MRDITREDVKAWVDAMASRGVPAPTIDKAARTLRACLNEALKDGKLEVNPATRIETPDVADREAFFLTAGQVDAIAQAVPDRDRALVYCLAYTGMRIGEASALRLRNVDFLRKRIAISENSPEVAGRKLPPGKTKSKSKRAVPMFDELARNLRRIWIDSDCVTRLGTWTRSLSSLPRAVETLFGRTTSEVEPFSPPRSVSALFGKQQRTERATRVHDLRHTFASLAAASGYSLHELKTMLGHSTITITSNLYAHLYDDHMTEKAATLGGVMRSAREGGKVMALSQREASVSAVSGPQPVEVTKNRPGTVREL